MLIIEGPCRLGNRLRALTLRDQHSLAVCDKDPYHRQLAMPLQRAA